MIGEDYQSYDEFIAACESPETELDHGHTLAKVYTIEQIKNFAEIQNISTNVILEDIAGQGRQRTYECAYKLANLMDADTVGELLSNGDHNMYFPFLSYGALPRRKLYRSLNHFLEYLASKDIVLDSDFIFLNNGLVNPHGRNCKLESVYASADNNSASMLYSCSRILVQPERPLGDYSNWFLARIPVLVRILFSHRLIEFSLPRFSEPTNIGAWSNNIPLRYQMAINSAQIEFLRLIGYQIRSIDYNKLTLFLEERLNAQDLGWKIAPLETAQFDLEQNTIPLKSILMHFSESLKREIERRGLEHSLSNVDLYKIFRALKEESYTYSLVLRAPIRIRGGSVKISVLYGNQDSSYLPVIILSRNDEEISNSLRDAIVDSREETLNNPYDLGTLLSDQN